MVKFVISLLLLIPLLACKEDAVKKGKDVVKLSSEIQVLNETSLVILGTTQDAGSPQIGCEKACCTSIKTSEDRLVCAMGIVDPQSDKKYLIDATPDIERQINILNQYSSTKEIPEDIFLTHAHIGHYTGLMFLGKEGANTQGVNVHVMDRMKSFLETNGPWNQLVNNDNISLEKINNKDTLYLSETLKLIPFLVPHRDEYSETVGYKIIGPKRSAIFIPDIDKWNKWKNNIVEEIAMVDFAFIDGTFYDEEEINYRDISEIPHPFIIESIELLKKLSSKEKNKVYFIHLNHTNPALDEGSEAYQAIMESGFHVAKLNEVFPL